MPKAAFGDLQHFLGGGMDSQNKHDIALSFWTVSFQYLMLVENVAREIISQGNAWVMVKGNEFTIDDYKEGTRWSDHVLIIPLLFNLYHGIELLVKGFLHIKPDQKVNSKHGNGEWWCQFSQVYPAETEMIEVFSRYTNRQHLPPLISNFLRDNTIELKDLYQALRYPSDINISTVHKYMELKYQDVNGVTFFQMLVNDIETLRVAAVRLGRSLEIGYVG